MTVPPAGSEPGGTVRRALRIGRFQGRTWAVVSEDDRVVELRAEEPPERRSAVGRIVLGRVTRIIPGIQVAFVDIGLERDAFLHVDDLAPADRGRAGRAGGIEACLAPGREVVVQVSRDPLGKKGARVRGDVSLPGRYLVYLPGSSHRGVSRRIEDAELRAAARRAVRGLPEGGGFILRTAGASAAPEELAEDALTAKSRFAEIEAGASAGGAPRTLHDELDLLGRMLRDTPGGGFDRVVVETEADRARVVAARDVVPAGAIELAPRAFAAVDLEAEIAGALDPVVRLPSGGTIVIEPTEAMVTIDVNTARFTGDGPPRETVLRTNREAADEVARQVRLRDLGGIVVVDFIDMDASEDRARVLEVLRDGLRRDPSRTRVYPPTALGLVQLTRKRTRGGPVEALTRSCPRCAGRGSVRSAITVARAAARAIERIAPEMEAARVTVRAHPDVLRAFPAAWSEAAADTDGGRPSLEVRLDEDAISFPDGFGLVVE